MTWFATITVACFILTCTPATKSRTEQARHKRSGRAVHAQGAPLLERLLRGLQALAVPEAVEVREHAHHLGHAALLQQHQELERLHLEAKGAVHHQQHQVRNLGGVDHAAEVLRALKQGEPPALAGDDGDGTANRADVLARVVLDEAADERALADAWRAMDEHKERGWLKLRVGVSGDRRRHCNNVKDV